MIKKYETRLKAFNASLPLALKDMKLLKMVFVHRSFLNEDDGAGLESNERLEFLGDAVLGAATAHMLYKKFPALNEGELTRMRARLVNRRTLAGLAGDMGLGSLLLLGKGEAAGGGAQNPKTLAAVLEALIGAVYLERGFKKTLEFIEGLLGALAEDAQKVPGWFDYKPALQELTQKIFKRSPEYRVTLEEGPPHKKTFEVEVSVDSRVLAKGKGARIKDAEQNAARKALEEARKKIPDKKKTGKGLEK
ncbi:MAG: ribonuclease III [Thermodesulfobacteriota bacterium]|nr:MAG: ribonuclease III [Thermodesulfobacteriota bacterium]